jgi:hypothetical protein
VLTISSSESVAVIRWPISLRATVLLYDICSSLDSACRSFIDCSTSVSSAIFRSLSRILRARALMLSASSPTSFSIRISIRFRGAPATNASVSFFRRTTGETSIRAAAKAAMAGRRMEAVTPTRRIVRFAEAEKT